MGGEIWELRWNSILVYYIVAAVITLAGLICFYGIAFHPVGKQMFRHKDEELRSMNVRSITSVNVRAVAAAGVKQIGGASLNSALHSHLLIPRFPCRRFLRPTRRRHW